MSARLKSTTAPKKVIAATQVAASDVFVQKGTSL